MANSEDLPSDIANASATTIPLSNTHEPTGRTLWVHPEYKKGTGLSRSSLVFHGTNSRCYSPLYEHRDVYAVAITTARPLELQGSLHIGSFICKPGTGIHLASARVTIFGFTDLHQVHKNNSPTYMWVS